MKTLWYAHLVLLPFSSLLAQTNPAPFSAVSVLTIHVSDTNTHDGVFRFLTEVLRLPVDYGPEIHGLRRYAAVYAGNLFIEPCGPFPETRYPLKDFKALFYGLNCVSPQSPSSLAALLEHSKLAYEKTGPGKFRIQDASVAEGIYLGIDTQPKNQTAQQREALLASTLTANQADGLGFEYIREIWVGCTKPGELQAWSSFLGSAGKVDDTLWRLDSHQNLRFVRSEVRGVRGIVCQVRSVEKAREYLRRANCPSQFANGRIELDQFKTFGLFMGLVESGSPLNNPQ